MAVTEGKPDNPGMLLADGMAGAGLPPAPPKN